MSLKEFNEIFNVSIHYKKSKTLSELLTNILGHHPSEGEVIHFEQFEFTIIEPSLLGAKTVKIKTIH